MLKQSESSGNHDNEQSHTSEKADQNVDDDSKLSDTKNTADDKKVGEKYADYLDEHGFPRDSYTDVEIIKFNPGWFSSYFITSLPIFNFCYYSILFL